MEFRLDIMINKTKASPNKHQQTKPFPSGKRVQHTIGTKTVAEFPPLEVFKVQPDTC